jgi:hypothetical protein
MVGRTFKLRLRNPARLGVLALAALLPAACAAPRIAPPANPFAGGWTTPERQQIVFRDGTVLIQPDNAAPTPLSAASCDGRFSFGYARKSRADLLTLAPTQPDVTGKLAELLARPDYPVAEAVCGGGATTYVLLDERDLVAIHRDADVAGIERLSRL